MTVIFSVYFGEHILGQQIIFGIYEVVCRALSTGLIKSFIGIFLI